MIALKSLPYPPTSNHRYEPANNRLRLSSEHRDYKSHLAEWLEIHYPGAGDRSLEGRTVAVTVIYFGDFTHWFTKNGKIRKIDADNRHKTMLDTVFTHVKLEDSQAFSVLLVRGIRPGLAEIEVDVKIEEIPVDEVLYDRN